MFDAYFLSTNFLLKTNEHQFLDGKVFEYYF